MQRNKGSTKNNGGQDQAPAPAPAPAPTPAPTPAADADADAADAAADAADAAADAADAAPAAPRSCLNEKLKRRKVELDTPSHETPYTPGSTHPGGLFDKGVLVGLDETVVEFMQAFGWVALKSDGATTYTYVDDRYYTRRVSTLGASADMVAFQQTTFNLRRSFACGVVHLKIEGPSLISALLLPSFEDHRAQYRLELRNTPEGGAIQHAQLITRFDSLSELEHRIQDCTSAIFRSINLKNNVFFVINADPKNGLIGNTDILEILCGVLHVLKYNGSRLKIFLIINKVDCLRGYVPKTTDSSCPIAVSINDEDKDNIPTTVQPALAEFFKDVDKRYPCIYEYLHIGCMIQKGDDPPHISLLKQASVFKYHNSLFGHDFNDYQPVMQVVRREVERDGSGNSHILLIPEANLVSAQPALDPALPHAEAPAAPAVAELKDLVNSQLSYDVKLYREFCLAKGYASLEDEEHWYIIQELKKQVIACSSLRRPLEWQNQAGCFLSIPRVPVYIGADVSQVFDLCELEKLHGFDTGQFNYNGKSYQVNQITAARVYFHTLGGKLEEIENKQQILHEKKQEPAAVPAVVSVPRAEAPAAPAAAMLERLSKSALSDPFKSWMPIYIQHCAKGWSFLCQHTDTSRNIGDILRELTPQIIQCGGLVSFRTWRDPPCAPEFPVYLCSEDGCEDQTRVYDFAELETLPGFDEGKFECDGKWYKVDEISPAIWYFYELREMIKIIKQKPKEEQCIQKEPAAAAALAAADERGSSPENYYDAVEAQGDDVAAASAAADERGSSPENYYDAAGDDAAGDDAAGDALRYLFSQFIFDGVLRTLASLKV